MSDPATGSDPAAESEIATESELVSNATSDESHVDDELKENVKEIVKILRSRGPHSKSPELERDFVCDSEFFESTMAEVRPTPERLKKFAAVLSSMFIRNMEGKFRVLGREISAGSWNPAFAEEFRPQTFSISNPQLVSIGSILDTSADQFREYTMSSRAEAYQYGVDPEIYDNSDAWDWKMPAVPGYFRHYFVTRIEGNKCGVFKLPSVHEAVTQKNPSGYGYLCLIGAPVQDGGLDFYWVNFAFAQISRWDYYQDPRRPLFPHESDDHFDSVMYFLAVFAGFWAPRKKRLDLSKQFHINRDNFYRHYLQVHFRCFAAVKRLTKCGNTCGLRCVREQGQIMSTSHGGTSYYFEEQRISIFGLISEQDDPCEPIFYSVLVLNENAQIYPLDDLDWNCLDWRPGLEGPLTFQVAVLGSVDIWEAEWNKALDQIDDCLQVKMDQTLNPEKLKELMFDDNFGRSQQYFTILQTLRIFGEWVRTVSDDLRGLDDLFLKEGDFPLLFMSPEESQTLKSNWESVRKTQKRAEENLMSRILNKTEEVKSLRDGLFNASSLREARESAKIAKQSSELAKQSAEMTEISLRMANESSDMAKRSLIMGRYVLIFTVVTVLYLPPSFISTVFALNIFQKDPSQTKWEYKVTLVSVSLVTYAVAFVAVIAAKGGRKLIPGSSRGSSPVNGTAAAINVQPDNKSAQEEPTPAAAGSAPEVRDEESGVPREKEHWHSHLPVGRLVRRVLRPKGPE